MQDIFIEYLVKRQNTAKTALLRLLVILAAIILVIAFGFLTATGLLGAFSMVALLVAVGVIYGAYQLISGMSVEYEYAVTNGELDVDQIIAQRKRKRLVSVNMKTVEAFGRYNAAEHQGKNYRTRIIACDHPANPDLWYAVIHLQQSGQTLVVFNANQKMLDGLRPFLPAPIRHEVFNKPGNN